MQAMGMGFFSTSVGALALTCLATVAAAQSFPSRPITIVVPYSAGGQADALARSIGQRLGENLKTNVVVDNKPGGNALIGAQFVAKSRPDGYTLVLATDALTTIDPNLPGPSKFEPMAALEPVINLVTAPLFLAAKKDLPATSVSEVAALGKKDPKGLSFGTSGPTTPHRLAGELLQQAGGFTMTHVAYKGTSASVNDLAGGHIELVIGAASSLVPLAESGMIKILATTSEKRFPALPDVPAVSETYNGFNVVSYMGLMAPKGTPAPVIATLNGAIDKILSDPEMRGALEKQGMVALGRSAADFKAQIETDSKARGKLIRELNITAD
jgi:tripartite-type tricarboxylate transporter receptor subunit TctC